MNQSQHDCPSLPQIEGSSGRLCDSVNFGVHQLVLLQAGSPSDAHPGVGGCPGLGGTPASYASTWGTGCSPGTKVVGTNAAHLPLPGWVYRGWDGCRGGLLLALGWQRKAAGL